jgi:putative N6-adenine-specific DNA methylase
LYDPFCGSGTIAIEAALYAWDIAPGIGRAFALDRLLLGDSKTSQRIRQEYLEKVNFSRLVRIGGSDSDAASAAAAKQNLERAIALSGKQGPQNLPLFKVLPMEKAEIPDTMSNKQEAGEQDEPGFIITNPPYGRRLSDTETAEKTYSEMRKLSSRFPLWKLAVITDHSGFESFFGKRADSCREITNGAIRSYLFQYEKLEN